MTDRARTSRLRTVGSVTSPVHVEADFASHAHPIIDLASSGPSATDESLVKAIALGDAEAFRMLYQRLTPSVMGIALRIIRNVAHAEEVTQEVMLQVWRTAPTYDPVRAKPRTWILTMAHSRAADRIRSAEAAALRDQRHHQGAVPDYDVVVEQVEASLDRERVRHAMASLTELQREVLELAYYRGYTHHQVAQVLDIPLGTAKTRIRDGLIRLRDTLGATS